MILVIQHKVRDFDAWKPVFDEQEPVRQTYGCTGHFVFRDSDVPTDLTVLLQFPSRQAAEAFLAGPSMEQVAIAKHEMAGASVGLTHRLLSSNTGFPRQDHAPCAGSPGSWPPTDAGAPPDATRTTLLCKTGSGSGKPRG